MMSPLKIKFIFQLTVSIVPCMVNSLTRMIKTTKDVVMMKLDFIGFGKSTNRYHMPFIDAAKQFEVTGYYL